MLTLVYTPCSCAVILDDRGVMVIDSDKLPSTCILIIAIIIEGECYCINSMFGTRADFVQYLNTTFNDAYNFDGEWIEDSAIYYTNPEGFETLEIMAIYQTQSLTLKIGAPSYSVQGPVIPRANGSVFFLPDLQKWNVLEVFAAGRIPNSAQVGYTWKSETGLLDLSALGEIENTYINLLVSQSADCEGDCDGGGGDSNGLSTIYFTLDGEDSVDLPESYWGATVTLVTANGIIVYPSDVDTRPDALTYDISEDGATLIFSGPTYGIISISGFGEANPAPPADQALEYSSTSLNQLFFNSSSLDRLTYNG